jgi:uncharacterized damage-inducible protein DinB
MKSPSDVTEAILHGWTINNKMDMMLIDLLPAEVWPQKIPGYSHKTVRMIGAHLHNCRSGWIKALGRKWGLAAPVFVDNQRVSQRQLVAALNGSAAVMLKLLEAGIANGNKMPRFAPGAVEFAGYMMMHDAHHRGQLIMATRLLGHPLPEKVSSKIWQWGKM